MEEDIEALVFHAATLGDLSAMRNLLDGEPKENAKDIISTPVSGSTPLIVACQHGFLEIVDYLIVECSADVEQLGSAFFHGNQIKGLSPLWCAAAAGHLDITKKLVFYNAQVNAATKNNSTPLFAACNPGYYEIVKYLIENGADVNAVNHWGSTCLLLACFHGNFEIAEHLIQHGAEINKKNEFGSTALFTAVNSGNCSVIKLLLDHGAETQVKYSNITPFLCAAFIGNVFVVRYFINNVCCKSIDKINAYELLGATFVDCRDDLLRGYECWKKAMEMRHENVNSPILKPVDVPPIAAFNNVTEVNTFDELEKVGKNREDMYMQALLIRGRIIGHGNVITLNYVRHRGIFYFRNGHGERCTQLLMYNLHMEQEFLEPRNLNTISSNLYLTAHFYNELYDAKSNLRDLPDTYFCRVLTLVQQTTKKINKAMQCSTKNERCFYQILILSIRQIGLLCELSSRLSAEEKLQVEKEITVLIGLNPKSNNGWTLLHLACSNVSTLCVYNASFPLPSGSVVEFLLKCGAPLHVRNNEGNTPLHTAALNMPRCKVVLKLLLDNGAHLDFRNKNGETVLDLLNPADITDIFPLHYLNLKCLCTQVIHKAQIPFRGAVTKTLEKFIYAH